MEDLIRAQILDIKVLRGEHFDYVFTLTKLSDGSAYSLAGKTLKIEVKKKGVIGAAAAKTITNASGLSIGGASDNVITFDFDWDIDADLYVWDAEIIEDKKTIFRGDVQVIQDVTSNP